MHLGQQRLDSEYSRADVDQEEVRYLHLGGKEVLPERSDKVEQY